MVFKNIYANVLSGVSNVLAPTYAKLTGGKVTRKATAEDVFAVGGGTPLKILDYGTQALIGGAVISKVATSVKAVGGTQTALNILKYTSSKKGLYTGVKIGGAYILTNLLTANPKIVTAAYDGIENLGATGSDIGEYSKNPTLEGALQLIKEHPYITGLSATALITLVGVKGAGIINNILTNKNIKDLSDEVKDNVKNVTPDNYLQQGQPIVIQNYIPNVATSGATPLNPDVATEQTKPKAKKKKKKSKKKPTKKKKKRSVAKKKKSKKKKSKKKAKYKKKGK